MNVRTITFKMKKRILLVNPPHWYKTRYHWYPEAPPMGLMYLASVLREKFDVMVYDAEYFADTPQSLALVLKEFYRPDIVGFTSTVLNYISMNECIAAVREHLPETKIVVGGAMVTSLSDEELKENIDFDLCVTGECEGNIAEIIDSAVGIVKGKPMENIDEIPEISRDKLIVPVTEYKGNEPKYKLPECQMLWSRGCPHDCIFCANSVFGKQKIRFRAPPLIIEELKHIVELGVKSIFVYDDELIGQGPKQTEWIREVCNRIIEAGLHKKLIFKCQARCNPKVFNLEDLKLMRKAGFRAIMWGIESGSPKVLKTIRKGITPDDVRTVFSWCKKAKIQTYAFMMVGSMSETPEDIDMSRALIKEIKPDWVQWTCATPLKPTKFHEMVKDQITEGINEKPIYFYYPMVSTDTMTRDEIYNEYNKLIREEYLSRLMSRKMIIRYIRETLFTKRGRQVFFYRMRKYFRLKREGII